MRRIMSGGLARRGDCAEEIGPEMADLQPPKPGDGLVVRPLAHRRWGDLEKTGQLGIGAIAEGLAEFDLGHGLRIHGATLRPLNSNVKSAKDMGI